MSRLEDLSNDQESLLDPISEEWINAAHSGETYVDQRKASECIKKIYALAELKKPEVIFLNGPMEAMEFCHKNLKEKPETIDWFGIGYDAGWVSFYDYFQRIGVLERDDEEFNIIKEFMRSGTWATVLYDGLAICIARPSLVKTDERGNLHNDKGPAIAFNDGYEEYAWHGTWVTEKIILTPEKLTKEEIINEKNSEVSRAIAERLGWDKYMETIGTVLIDKWFDSEKSLHYELYDFKERRGELMPRLLKMESPEIHDGTRPYYIEPVDPGLKTCQAARRWQFKKEDGEWPTVEESNKDPRLEFEIEA